MLDELAAPAVDMSTFLYEPEAGRPRASSPALDPEALAISGHSVVVISLFSRYNRGTIEEPVWSLSPTGG
jgi:hypothetical protein